jgi:hypothetical protein
VGTDGSTVQAVGLSASLDGPEWSLEIEERVSLDAASDTSATQHYDLVATSNALRRNTTGTSTIVMQLPIGAVWEAELRDLRSAREMSCTTESMGMINGRADVITVQCKAADGTAVTQRFARDVGVVETIFRSPVGQESTELKYELSSSR